MFLRAGWIVVGIVALLLSVSAAVPADVVGPPRGADGCPTALGRGGWRGDWPGPLVPAGEAVSVTMCELVLGAGDEPDRPGPARKLTARVEAMVAELNLLRTREELAAELRAREAAKGRVLSGDLHLGQACTMIGYGSELSFVVHYAGGRPPAVVLIDRNCGTATSAGRTRFGDPSDTFLAHYRRQLESRAGSVPSPQCAARLPAAGVDPEVMPRDDVAANRGLRRREFLPSPLAAVTVCRYRLDGDVLRLTSDARVPGPLDLTRALLEAAASPTVPDGRARGPEAYTECGAPEWTGGPVTDLDVLRAADATGAIAEVRVWRQPCQAVSSGLASGLILGPDLRDRLDVWLGG
ncbi:hypothetical protein HII36_45360 [Nonomuraea sp. NN258]|uniref:hypothetical protein n=1 Tax=Nonomuraea antri TaxID=2730852 RepID=UPI00156833E8|nr:hypothetical protein [Nonomuraea antri]NRQ39002.1 hypothetical protein [Nonomuraea antri]